MANPEKRIGSLGSTNCEKVAVRNHASFYICIESGTVSQITPNHGNLTLYPLHKEMELGVKKENGGHGRHSCTVYRCFFGSYFQVPLLFVQRFFGMKFVRSKQTFEAKGEKIKAVRKGSEKPEQRTHH